MTEKAGLLKHWGRSAKEFLYGMAGHDMTRYALKTRGGMERLVGTGILVLSFAFLMLLGFEGLVFAAAQSPPDISAEGGPITPTPTPITTTSAPPSSSGEPMFRFDGVLSASGPSTPARGFRSDDFTASFYDAPDLSSFVLSRTYTTSIAFQRDCRNESWPYAGCKLIDELADGRDYSVRWEGQLLTPVSGWYTFTLANVDDGARMFLDGQAVVDRGWYWPDPDQQPSPQRHHLSAGWHEVTIDYEQRIYYVASLQVRWAGPGFANEVIPLTTAITTLKVNPLEQANLLNYTTLKGNPQRRPSRTTVTWTQEISSTWYTTVTVPVSNTGTITATGAVVTLTAPSALELLPDPGCVTCPVESRALGEIAPGEIITARWLVATTWPTNTATPADYAWPVSLQAVADNAPTEEITGQIGAEIVYDSGYEVGRNAYYPINDPTCAYPDCVGPIDWSVSALQRRWEIFKEVYRKESLPSSPLLADPKTLFYFAAIHPQAFGAYCSGISVSNEDRLSGCANLPGCGGAQDLWVWSQQPGNKTTFKEEMETYQGKILTQEALAFDLAQMALAEVLPAADRNNEVFEAIRDAIDSNTTDRWVLQFLPKISDLVGKTPGEVVEEIGSAHSVEPYLVTESARGKRIYIYDPNKPKNPSSPFPTINAVQINADGYFHYDDRTDEYDQNDADKVLDLLAAFRYYFYRDAGRLPFSEFNLYGVLSPAHLVVTDDQGRTMGIPPDGQFVAQIPDSGPIPGVPREIYAAPSKEAPHVVATVWGDAPGDYTYFQFQGDGLFLVQDASVTTTSVDTVDVSADGLAMRYTTNDAAKTYSAVLVEEGPDYGRVYTAAHTSLAAGEVVTFRVGADLSTFTYTNPGGAKQYDLGLEQTGLYSGAVSFPGLEMGAKEAHVVSVEDWDHLPTTRITIGVDEGNDGSIDETIVLQGQPSDDAPNSMDEVTESSPNGDKIERTIAPSGDEDWFRFQLAEEAKINVQLTSLPADYDLYLYDESGDLLDASTRRGRRSERIVLKHQPAGLYYVRVAGYAGAWDESDTYLLRFKVNPHGKGRKAR